MGAPCGGSVRVGAQLRAILHKNWLLTARNRRDALREFGTPIILVGVLVLLSRVGGPRAFPARLNADQPLASLGQAAGGGAVALAPCAAPGDGSVAGALAAALAVDVATQCFPTEAALVAHATNATTAAGVFGGVVVDAGSRTNASAPFAYRLRFDAGTRLPGLSTASTAAGWAADGRALPPSSAAGAYLPAFLPLQLAVDAAWGAAVTRGAAPPLIPAGGALTTRQAPSPAFSVDAVASTLLYVAPVYLTLVFTVLVRVLLTRILEEKERRLKVTLKMQGLGDGVFWASWLVTALVKNTLVVTAVAATVCFAGVFRASSFTLVWAFFVLFELSAIAFSFAMTPLFSRSRTGGAVGMLVYLALSAPAYALTATGSVPAGAKVALSLLAPVAFNLGATMLVQAEGAGTGLSWATAGDPGATPTGVSMGAVLGLLAVDVAAYLGLAWWLDQVVPTEHGVVKHPLFCCGFRRRGQHGGGGPPHAAAGGGGDAGRQRTPLPERAPLLPAAADGVAAATRVAAARAPLPGDVEPVPADVAARPGVRIRGMRKVYPGPTPGHPPVAAVDDLDLDLYEGQVTCLLGHNGAGKTTLVSLLTGLAEASGGDATVYGRSVVGDMDGVRRLLGVCPQHDDALYDRLTVMEHLRLWGAIRGFTGADLDARVGAMVADVGLQDKAHTWASRLSGGQRRRLSVALALVGDPKVVFLDEPTASLDVAARRRLWSLIQRLKQGRVVCLTTHHMEEAEALGDRVAIMARGRLRVAGSPLFLKARFGVGYRLTVTARLPPQPAAAVGAQPTAADAQALTAVVAAHVPGAQLERTRGTLAVPASGGPAVPAADVTYTLPRDAVGQYEGLLAELDEDAAADGAGRLGLLGGGHVSVSMTTLEEVFLRLAHVVEEEEAAAAAHAAEAEADAAAHGAAGAAALRATVKEVATQPGSPPADEAAGAWWLSVAVRHAAAAAAPKLTAAARLRRQLAVQIWRRGLQLRRDPRGIWLQCVTPVIFVGVSTVFRLLRGIDLGGPPAQLPPVPMSPAAALAPALAGTGVSAFSLPYAGVSAGDVAAAAAWLAGLPTVPGAPLPAADPGPASSDALAAQLLANVSYAAGALLVTAVPGGGTSVATTLLYNYTLPAVLPSLVALLDTAAVRAAVGAAPVPLIAVTLDPLPPVAGANGAASGGALAQLGSFLSAQLLGFYTAMGFVTIPAVQAANVVAERESRAKRMQLIMGATPFGLWGATWAWDALQSLLPSAGGLAILLAAGPDYVRTPANGLASAALLLLYGLSVPGPTYAATFLFGTAADAQLWVRLGYSGLTLVLFFASFGLSFPGVGLSPAWAWLPTAINYAGSAFPPAALAIGLSRIGVSASCINAAVAGGECTPPSPFSWGVAGAPLVLMAATIPLWFGALMAVESRALPSGGGGRAAAAVPAADDGAAAYSTLAGDGVTAAATASGAGPAQAASCSVEDADVRAERARVDALVASSATSSSTAADVEAGGDSRGVLVWHLRKVYDSRGRLLAALCGGGRRAAAPAASTVAVADLSFRAAAGESFALLGANGAGKSTTISMLVGELAPTAGSASFFGVPLAAAPSAAWAGEPLLGYCPQSDALFDSLTGEEVLTFYAALHGVPAAQVARLVGAAIASLGLQPHRHKLTRQYSGGNKRRLSMAVAYITAPRVVLLDEASTGVDPDARRRLATLVEAGRPGRATLVTTHVMEEAEALATRIGIMVDGRLACVGTSDALKRTYGRGYQVDVKLAAADDDSTGGGAQAAAEQRVAAALAAAAPGGAAASVRLVERHVGHARFEVVDARLAPLFGALERLRLAPGSGLIEFGVSQRTLEAVFLAFAGLQQALQDARSSAAAAAAAAAAAQADVQGGGWGASGGTKGSAQPVL